MKIKAFLIVITALIALSAGIAARNLTNSINDGDKQALSEFTLPDISGKQRSILEWRGKILIINFWATWCPPCLKEIPEFIALQDQLGGKGLQFIGIAIDEKEPVETYIASVKLNYPILIGEDAGVALAHHLGNKVNAVPYSIVVDRNGIIIHRQAGEFLREQILEIINPLL